MENRYRRREVLEGLTGMVRTVCGDVYTSSRETVRSSSETFVVVRLPQGIEPYADTHNTAYVQLQLFAKDIANGVESVDRMERLLDGMCTLFPFDNEVMSCNEKPTLLGTFSDGMGYHSMVMQFRIVIKV